MSSDDHIADLVKEEEINDYDYIDEDNIGGGVKRGGNKAALKNTKGFADATQATMRKSPPKSPSTVARKVALSRSQQTMVADKFDWETKLKISRKQQKQTNYTFEPVKADDHKETVKSATPKTGKFSGPDVGRKERAGRVDARANIEDASPKEESVKAWNAWDDENPWG